MKRRPILYVLNLIFPTCALYLLDMTILFSSSSYEDNISFQLSLIIGESVLALILKDILPTSSDDPPIIECLCPNDYGCIGDLPINAAEEETPPPFPQGYETAEMP
ncbi:unnamed protein product [Eretmochelys imbricata]